jgi:predicted phosphate transport protein (TIGR00153 family)
MTAAGARGAGRGPPGRAQVAEERPIARTIVEATDPGGRPCPLPSRPEHRVRFRLTPQDTSFYDLFARLAGHLVEGSALLTQVVAAHPTGREALAQKMRDAEHAADEATHELLRKVNSSFITPFDREDIYALASNLDDCMDHMEAAVDRIMLYKLEVLPAGVVAQVEVLVRMSELTAEAMPRLRSMADLSEYWIEINRLENQGDQVYRRLIAELFNGDLKATAILKLKDVVEGLEAAADAFETVAHTVESIAVKES